LAGRTEAVTAAAACAVLILARSIQEATHDLAKVLDEQCIVSDLASIRIITFPW
jgi:hypothetical protein